MTKPRPVPTSQLPLVVAAFLSHWFIALLCQAEATWIYGATTWTDEQRWLDLLSAQSENIAIAALLAALGILTGARMWARYCFVALVTLANLLLAINILSLKFFSQHFRLSFTEGPLEGGEALLDSIRYEVDWVVFLNLGLVALFAGLLLYLATGRTASAPRRMGATAFVAAMPAVVAIAAGQLMSIDPGSPLVKLRSHPLIALLNEDTKPLPPKPEDIDNKPIDLQFWTHGAAQPANADAAALITRTKVLRETNKQLNVILVVLESVGSLQLFPNDGLADPRITPNIARLQQSGVVFDSLYSPFPGTVRSHVALMTGGSTLTWGSVFHELSYPYTGPTINRRFGEAGYGTALFSSQLLQFENMDGFYRQLDWDHFYEFGQLEEDEQELHRLNSWGGEELNTLDRIFAWIEQRDHTRPFFVQYLNVATHHPYTAPEGYLGPASGDDRLPRYQNALHYTDRVIAELVTRLQQRGLDQNTLIAITGDHGQAFADRHANNLTHKNYLYEENVKNFLFLYHPAWNHAPVVSHRVASIGSIHPTLLGLTGHPPMDAAHPDLFDPEFDSKPVFFYKNAYPEKWGLRYGKWKYIATRDDNEVELYDLDADPTEQHNLAEQYRPHLGELRAAVQQWYLQTNDRFVAHLQDYQYIGGRGFQVADLDDFGPKIVAVGHEVDTADGVRFVEQDVVHPQENVVVWTKWLGYPYDRTFGYRFVGPNGEVHEFQFEVKEEWSTTRVKYDGAPMTEGTWRIELRDGDKKLIEKTYRVDGSAPLHSPLDAGVQALESAVGTYAARDRSQQDRFFAASTLQQTHIPVLWTRWRELPKSKDLTFQWQSPSGTIRQSQFEVKKGWDQSWVPYEGRPPLEPGNWRVRVIDPAAQRALIEQDFTVAPSH